MNNGDLKTAILRAALDAGFCAARIYAPPKPVSGEWAGEAGLAEPPGSGASLRPGPVMLVCALPYGNTGPSAPAGPPPMENAVAVAPFARRNYYRAAVRRLRALAAAFRRRFGKSGDGSAERRLYQIRCNSPVPEKPLATASGLGAAGRNGLVITREAGSLVILAAMTLPFDLEGDGPVPSGPGGFPFCENCGPPEKSPCVAACPAAALPGDGSLIKERCIQWYASGGEPCGEAPAEGQARTAGASGTPQPVRALAEAAGGGARLPGRSGGPPASGPGRGGGAAEKGDLAEIPAEAAARWGRRLYGCACCQDACPHNRRPIDPAAVDEGPLPAWLDGGELLALDDEALKGRFRGTAIGMSWLTARVLRRSIKAALGK